MSRSRGWAVVLVLLVATIGCTPSATDSTASSSEAAVTLQETPFVARNARLLRLESLKFTPDGSNTRVTWRIPGLDPGVSQVDVPGDGLIPLWLAEPVDVRRAPGVLVVGVGEDILDRTLQDARVARREVRGFFPEWNGQLVVEVPSSQTALMGALNGQDGAYDGVAAITSSPDGSRDADSAIHVFVNAGVYDQMAPSAARIVMTHEVVHVATQAPIVSVPLWWAEGLADYVAFSQVNRRDAAAAVALTARAQHQLAGYLSDHGVPDQLPQPEAFTGDDPAATYESARLAVETLTELPGSDGDPPADAALVELQERLAGGMPEERAVPLVFGTSYGGFVDVWQARLNRVALAG